MREKSMRRFCDNAARVYVDATAKTVRLVATINVDAELGPQCELYGKDWTIGFSEAMERAAEVGFWGVFDEISGKVAGGISFVDGAPMNELCDIIFNGTTDTVSVHGQSMQSMEKLAGLSTGEYGVIVF